MPPIFVRRHLNRHNLLCMNYITKPLKTACWTHQRFSYAFRWQFWAVRNANIVLRTVLRVELFTQPTARNLNVKRKRIRDASIYTSKKYRSSFYSWAIFFCFHLSGSNSRYLLSGVLGGSVAALLITSDIYSKKLTPCSLQEHASE